MIDQVKLHVGYIGKTRDGNRVDIVDYEPEKPWPYTGNNGETYTQEGSSHYSGDPYSRDIIGPWVDEPAVGEWIGWNGGPCPVYPETVVEYCWEEGTNTVDAGRLNWDMKPNKLFAYRVIREHTEPPKPREFWLKLTSTGHGIPTIHDHAVVGAIHVREVLE